MAYANSADPGSTVFVIPLKKQLHEKQKLGQNSME